MSSFKEAFAKARKEGKKEFTWNGGKYHTRTKEEEGSSKRPKARPEAKSSRPKARPEAPSSPRPKAREEKAPKKGTASPRYSDEGLTVPSVDEKPKETSSPSPRKFSGSSGEASASTTAKSGRAPKGKPITFLRHVIEEKTPRRNSRRGKN